MGKVTPGRLDRRVTVQVRTKVVDTYGQDTSTYATLTTVWAQFTPSSQSEPFTAGQRMAVELATWRVRRSSAWVPNAAEHRLYEARTGKTWEIQGVAEIGRQEAWDLTAQVVNG
jgi:head-tail adaptor